MKFVVDEIPDDCPYYSCDSVCTLRYGKQCHRFDINNKDRNEYECDCLITFDAIRRSKQWD